MAQNEHARAEHRINSTCRDFITHFKSQIRESARLIKKALLECKITVPNCRMLYMWDALKDTCVLTMNDQSSYLTVLVKFNDILTSS
ncbi:hypothetical protein AO390_01355 [Pseudomonas marginalis ICMP 11289]|nr:hypothetical protein AO390_01355 [Pseudomonas marginalis ICMP 11289]